MTRKIWYRNSSLPVILGEIRPDRKGSIFRVSMRLDWVVFLISFVLLGGLGSVTISFLSDLLISFKQISPGDAEEIFSSLGVFVLLCLFFLVPYKIEANIARKMLFIVFEAESKENVIFYNRFLGLRQFQQIAILFVLAILMILLVALIKLILM